MFMLTNEDHFILQIFKCFCMMILLYKEPVLVIEIDTRNQRGIGIECVDGVQPPPEPDLEHHHVGLLPRKVEAGGNGRILEVGQRRRSPCTVDCLEKRDELGIRRLRPIEANSLVETE